jgi:hypothetical protein
MDKTWSCISCGCEYIEHHTDRVSSHLDKYIHYAGLCGEKCLKHYSTEKQHKFAVKMLLEGEALKLKHNGIKVY